MIRATPMAIDDLSIPEGVDAKTVVELIDSKDFDPESFDYTLWTDGSGHTDGYGAAASIWRASDGEMDLSLSANYGQTVGRNEFTAFLDGLTAILGHRIHKMRGVLEMNPKNEIASLAGGDRVTVAWYTDRQNLAMSVLWNENGDPVFKRSADKDLWARYAYLSRHACVIPYHRHRNTIQEQAMCDALCSVMRDSAKEKDAEIKMKTIFTNIQWLNRPQKAVI